MNYLEFKRQLMVDPYSGAAAYVAARKRNPRCREAYAQAMQFEQQLQQALDVPVPGDLLDRCLAMMHLDHGTNPGPAGTGKAGDGSPAAGGNGPSGPRRWGWVPALAAGLVMGIGLTIGVVIFHDDEHQSIPEYLAHHWHYDGPDIVSRAVLEPMDPESIGKVLATLNLTLDHDQSEYFAYAKNCPTPNGLGVHLIMLTEHGPATVIYIPASKGVRANQFKLQGMQAEVIPLQRGTLAIVANTRAITERSRELLSQALQENGKLSI